MKRTILALFLLIPVSVFSKQRDTLGIAPQLTDEFLDTVVVDSPKSINDYSMIGISYGGTFRNTYFNPAKVGTKFGFAPDHFALTFTNYNKMFGYLPYFGIQAGLAYGKEGFTFDLDDEGKPRGHDGGASDCTVKVIEIPVCAHFHVDMSMMKIMANAGIYGGYKLSIEREGPYLDPNYRNKFFEYENRWDFGFQGGAGIGLILSPLEFHLTATVRWGWQNLYEPDSNPFSQYPKYYYRFAYPLDLIVSFGVHYQITKRTGKTTKYLKQQAYNTVYGATENN